MATPPSRSTRTARRQPTTFAPAVGPPPPGRSSRSRRTAPPGVPLGRCALPNKVQLCCPGHLGGIFKCAQLPWHTRHELAKTIRVHVATILRDVVKTCTRHADGFCSPYSATTYPDILAVTTQPAQEMFKNDWLVSLVLVLEWAGCPMAKPFLCGLLFWNAPGVW